MVRVQAAGASDDGTDFAFGNSAWDDSRGRPRLKSPYPQDEKATSPARDGLSAHPERSSDVDILSALGGQQNDPRPQFSPCHGAAVPGPTLEPDAFFGTQVDARGNAHAMVDVCARLAGSLRSAHAYGVS
jgi:hypothetical protein